MHLYNASISIFFICCWLLVVSSYSDKFNEKFEHIKPNTSEEVQTKAAVETISRLIPEYSKYFIIRVNFSLPNNYFKIFKDKATTNNVYITASNGVSASRAFHFYLKYYLNSHISWEGVQLQNVKLPFPDIAIEVHSKNRFIYYQNVCTYSYSYPWWTWKEWRKHLDWMAFQGINIFLAPVHEEIWTRMYRKVNLTENEIEDHISGPGFLAWQRMGNIKGWGGPLSENFKKFSLTLQKQIISAARDLGMVVALPGFAGHLPLGMKRIFPNSTFTPVERWNHFEDQFCCPLYLDPTDSLFKCFAEWLLMEVIKEYGTDHIYFSDPFNEIQPRLSTEEYLHDVSKEIYSSMKAVDDRAIWLLQGWMFVKNPFWNERLMKSFLTANEIGSMLILDLQSEQHPQYERTESYYGQPFIWCMLHNFGGTLGMQGSLDIVNERPLEAFNAKNSSMVGFGITPEGINQNYMMYEFALEMGLLMEKQNLTTWLSTYHTSRYGSYSENILNAWIALTKSVYNFDGEQQMRGKYIYNRRPTIKLNPWTWYNSTYVKNAWSLFLSMSDQYKNSQLYQHDLVDITRQYLQILTDRYYVQIRKSYEQKYLTKLVLLKDDFKKILVDLERILKTNVNFMLGTWLKSANDFAHLINDSDIKDLYELNARYQISLWGPKAEILDYANKQWSGVVRSLFIPRWEIFFNALISSLITNRTLNSELLKRSIMQHVEYPFVNSKDYDTETEGDSIETSKQLYQKWIGRENWLEIPDIEIFDYFEL